MKPNLEAIREREQKATEGPWGHSREDMLSYLGDGTQVSYIYPRGLSTRIQVATESPVEDAQFIAHARQDIPALLDYCEELERRVGELEADKRRLDWIEAQGSIQIEVDINDTVEINPYEERWMGDDLRQAINAAMKEKS